MWYFSWILGLGLALTFGVLNAMWYEIREGKPAIDPRARQDDTAPGESHPPHGR
jgi:cytochrome bd-I ubiquinol oxidase subunit X